MEYAFHIYNKLAADGMLMATEKLLQQRAVNNPTSPFSKRNDATPVIVCVGSDLAIGDSLGPIAGSMLKYKTQGNSAFIYGTLSSPVTAKEIKYLRAFLKDAHPKSPVIAVDAAVGSEGDIGLIKVLDAPLYPGAGANKRLGAIGDISILGIVAEKSVANYGLFNRTRLNLVYSMAEIVSETLASLLWQRKGAQTGKTSG
ncbi:MAG: spore protease YyaC [Clostridiales bacterium]|nr:spore protease YyaC [Clostridiales bacterium]